MKWEIASSMDKEYIFELAISKGWLEEPQKVQVKQIRSGMNIDEWWYIIEPYEESCTCPDLVPRPSLEAVEG